MRRSAALLSSILVMAAQAPGFHSDVEFAQYSPLSANSELLRRLLTPLAYGAMQRATARNGKSVVAQSVDLKQERFILTVPPEMPQAGYGLLVFVPPWQHAKMPRGWQAVLDAHHMIFVSANDSGNDASVLARRIPLAILAEQNVAGDFPLDKDRIYVGGFSGGSRIALRLAVAYPDIFRGAMLDAGADPIGDARLPLPPSDLVRTFQDQTRVQFITGERDLERLAMAATSEASFKENCAFHFGARIVANLDHEVIDAKTLSQALDALDAPAEPDARTETCRNELSRTLDEKIAAAKALLAQGRADDAQNQLIEIDRRFGGLAATPVLELEDSLGWKLPN